MSRYLLWTLVIGLTSFSQAQAELLTAWDFEGGTAAAGSVGSGDARYTGSLQGNATAGGTLQLDGSGDYLQFGNNLSEIRGLGAMTISAWVMPANTGTDVRRIAEHEDNFYFWSEGGTYRYTTHGTAGGAASQATSSPDGPTAGTWQHVVAVYEGNQPAKFYVDGVLQTTSAANQAPMAENVQTFQIGARRSSSGSPSNYFNGQIDDVAIYNHALTDADIATLAGNGGGYAARSAPTSVAATTSTLALWDFEELSGTLVDGGRVVDSSGFGRDAFSGGGANTPMVVASDSGYGNTALRFTSNRDSVIFRDGFSFADAGPAAGSDINFGQNDSFTIEAVIKPALDPAAPGTAGVILAKDVGGNQPSWWLRILDDGTLQAIVDDSVGGDGLVAGTTPINDDEWHHVAFVRDAINDEVRLYIDHQLEATAADNTLSHSINSNDIRIGEFNANNTLQFIGDIDVARISIGALAPDQFLQQQVPEPASLAIWGSVLGLAMLRTWRLRRRR